jgi:hypothetical protein
MKNKLLLTTALAGLVAVSGAHAETKVSGNLEQTWKSISDDANAGAASQEGFGTEYNIGLSSSSDLDNGMSASFGFNMEGGSSSDTVNKDSHYLTIGLNDAMSLTFGQDNGTNLSGTAVPHISDTASTIVGGGFHNIGIGKSDGHNDQHIRMDVNGMGGALTLRYVPNDGSANANHSSVGSESGGNSAYDVIYKGSLGVDGLSILTGIHTADENGSDVDTKYKVFGASYNFGSFTIGAERANSEGDVAAVSGTDITATTSGEKDEMQSDLIGITFAASDKLSFGLSRVETEYEDAGVKDAQEEETVMLGVGYSLGGLAVDINYAQTDNYGFTAQDRDTLQIRTIQKF